MATCTEFFSFKIYDVEWHSGADNQSKKKTLQNLLNQSSIHRERTNTTRDRHRQKKYDK